METFDDQVLLGCKFIASNYSDLVQAEWRKDSDHNFVMPSPKYEQPNFTWENSECVVIRLRINSPTQDDSGTYFCSVRYNSDIMSEKILVQSDSGQMDVNIGNVCLNVLPTIQCVNSYVTLFLHTNICLYSVSMLSNGINHNTIYFSCYCKAFWIATDVMLSVMLACSKFSTALI